MRGRITCQIRQWNIKGSFIRLSGELNHNTASRLENEVSKLIAEVGIKYIVFNIENLTLIDMAGIDVLLKNNDIVFNNQVNDFLF